MIFQNLKIICIFRNSAILFLTGLLTFQPFTVFAAATSTNFAITSDSVNCGGGRSTSSNFVLTNTLCEHGQNIVTSSNFRALGGFQGMEDIPFISVTLSSNSLNLGTLSSSAVASASIITTVSTNAEGGYNSTIVENTDLGNGTGGTISDVSDGSVSEGSSEYGFSTSGADGQYNATDTSITSAEKIYATRSSWTRAVQTTITLKAAISSSAPSGTYGNSITLVTTGTF